MTKDECDSCDPRIARTRQLLWSTLVSLMEEIGYEALSVSDITKRAKVNRSTFYRHFEDKDDLFRQGCSDLYDSIFRKLEESREDAGSSGGAWSLEYFDRLFELVDSERGVFAVIGGSSGSPDFRAIMRDKIETFILERRLPAEPLGPEAAGSPGMKPELELDAAALSAIISSLMALWFTKPGRYSRELVCRTYRSILVRGIPPYCRDAKGIGANAGGY